MTRMDPAAAGRDTLVHSRRPAAERRSVSQHEQRILSSESFLHRLHSAFASLRATFASLPLPPPPHLVGLRGAAALPRRRDTIHRALAPPFGRPRPARYGADIPLPVKN